MSLGYKQEPYVLSLRMCVVTLSGQRVKLLRQQVIAAAHAADCGQLRFGHKHPQGAGSQVATRMQADHDRVLEFRESTRRTEEEEVLRSMGRFIDDDAVQIWHHDNIPHSLW